MTLRSPGTVLLLMLAAADAAGQGTPQARYADGRLSVQADQAQVKIVLQQVAQQAGFKLHMVDGAGEARGSWTFSNLPLEEALTKLVRPDGLLIFYDPATEQGQPPRIAALHVLPPTVAATADAEPRTRLLQGAEANREAQHLRHLIMEPGDLDARHQAIADLAALDPADAARELEAALGVQEPALRQEVVRALGEIHRDTPPTALGQVLIGDRDAQVRRAAVLALSGLDGEAARLFVEQALKDKDEAVRALAAQALGR